MKSWNHVFIIFLVSGLSSIGPVAAAPVGEVVKAGSATFNRTPGNLTIHQQSSRVIIHWRDFSIARGEVTRFVQPSAHAAALNRVTGGNPTQIYGQLQANGRVYVINPNGIFVGPSGTINTHQFIGSTHDVADRDFLNGGRMKFSGDSTASIINLGTLEALGGDIYLVAHTVENQGTIRASEGQVGLAAGNEVLLQQAGRERITVRVSQASAPQTANGINNAGLIEAAAAELKAAGGNIYALAINNGGVVRANTVVNENGRIVLKASGGNIRNAGTLSARNADGSGGSVVVDGGHNAATPATVVNSGTIEARGTTPGTTGGEVTLTGDVLGLLDQSLIDVSGPAGGGTALVGGDYQGQNPRVQNAQSTFVSRDSAIKADALTEGDGGKVVVWADDETRFHGSISARGGPQGGNGGFVETSGKATLDLPRGVRVDASAPRGDGGTWLLDPTDITIIPTGGDLDAGPPYSPSAAANTIGADDIVGVLDSGTDVSISTASRFLGNGDITVNAPINASGSATLSLLAERDIQINKLISLPNGSLNLDAGRSVLSGTIDAGATFGALTVGGNANLRAGTDITLNQPGSTFGYLFLNAGGNATVREDDSTDLGPSTIGGNLTLTSAGPITQSGVLRVNGASAFQVSGAARNIILDLDNVLAGNMTMGVVDTGSGLGSLNDLTLRNTYQPLVLPLPVLQLPAAILGNVNLTFSGMGVDVPATTIVGSLNVTAHGDIADGGPLTVNDGAAFTTTADGADITLDQLNLTAGSLALSTRENPGLQDAHATVINGASLDLAAATIAGDLSLMASGPITQSGAIHARNLAARTRSDAGAAITLTRADNEVASVALRTRNALDSINAGGAIAYRDQSGVEVAGIQTASTVDLTAGGVVQQSGAVEAGSLAVKTLNDPGAAITLTRTDNEVGSVDLRARNALDSANANGTIAYRDQTGFTVAGAQTASTTDLTAGGPVQQSGAIQANALTVRTLADAGAAITLDRADNEVVTVDFRARSAADSINAAGVITYRDQNGFTIAGLQSAGLATLTAGGPVQQAGAIVAAALAVKTLSDAGADITLTRPDNEVASVALRARNALDNANAGGAIGYRDQSGVEVAGIQTASTVDLTAGGAVQQSGAIEGTTLTARTYNDAGAALTLNHAANEVTTVDLRARNAADSANANGAITYREQSGVTVAGIQTASTVDLTAGGAIQQSGAIVGTTLTAKTLNDAGAALTLEDAGNEVTTVDLRARNAADSANANGAIAYRDQSGVTVAGIRTAGVADLTAGGAVQQSGAIEAGALAVNTQNDGGAAITLTRPDNEVASVALRARNVLDNANAGGAIAYRDQSGVDVAGIQTSSTVDLTAGGAVQQSGAIEGTTLTAWTLNDAGAALTLNHAANEVTAVDLRARNAADGANANGAITFRDQSGVSVATVQTAGSADLIAGGLLALNGNVSGNGVSLIGNGVTQDAGLDLDGGSGDITVDANDGVIDLRGALRTASASGTALVLRDSTTAALGNLSAPNGTLVLGQAGPDNLNGDVTQNAGTVIVAGRLTVNAGGRVMLGRGLFQNPADPANPLNLIGLPLTAAPDVETQNRVDVLGDVNHGGEFYLVDVGPASALSLPGLTLNGRIEGANGQEAAQSPVTIRTLGDLTLDEGASIWTTSLGAGGNDVRLSAENNANFHNNAGAGAIQVDNPAANRKDDPLIRGSRYIIYSTDPKLNIPAESPGTTSLNFNGLYSHWQASPGTILSGQPGNDDGGNGFVFSIAQAPLTDEASKFFSDIIELKPPSAVTFSTKEGEAAPEIWPWICTSSTQVYQEEADRLKQKQKRPLAWHFPELRMVSVSLRHDWDEN